MKKIVGIIAAVAMIATSVFAADITAKVRLDGSLFNYAGGVKALTIDHNAGEAHNPLLAWSYGDDKSGASAKIWTKGDSAANFDLASGKFQIWFTPVDNLKLIFGNQNFNLNQEQLQWWRSDSGFGETGGYGVNFGSDGFSIDLFLGGDWGKAWLDGSAVGLTAAKLQYGADFGTVAAIMVANSSFKDLKFGVGYNNNFDGLFMFVNVLGYVNNGFNKVRAEIFAKGNVDSFGWAAWIPFDFTIADSKAALGANVKFTFNQFYLDINDGNFLGDFAMSIKPGMTGSVGKCGYEVAVNFDIGSSVAVSVPVNFTVEW
ncbi:MAG: hypothetical protein IK102_05285 [Treponema sp.]|nr:hypothetical protein [Treponema sp.]